MIIEPVQSGNGNDGARYRWQGEKRATDCAHGKLEAPMVESIGICETHQLPLDRQGECELCRLGGMPSKAPHSPSPWWVILIPLVLLLAGIVWVVSSFGSKPQILPPRGVPAATPATASPAQPVTKPVEPAAAPEPPAPPISREDIPVPEPKPKSPDP
jgi:hypothetical protein